MLHLVCFNIWSSDCRIRNSTQHLVFIQEWPTGHHPHSHGPLDLATNWLCNDLMPLPMPARGQHTMAVLRSPIIVNSPHISTNTSGPAPYLTVSAHILIPPTSCHGILLIDPSEWHEMDHTSTVQQHSVYVSVRHNLSHPHTSLHPATNVNTDTDNSFPMNAVAWTVWGKSQVTWIEFRVGEI